MIYLLYAGIGLVAGVCSGLFGIGGGIVIVPMLIYLAKASQAKAVGISLIALLLPVGAAAVYEYYGAGKINKADFLYGLLIAGGIFIGAYLGAHIGLGISDSAMRKTFAVFLILIGVRFLVLA